MLEIVSELQTALVIIVEVLVIIALGSSPR